MLAYQFCCVFSFLFLVVFNSCFTIPVEIENARLKLALAFPNSRNNIANDVPIIVANDAIEMLPVVTDKTRNDLSKYSREEIYLLSILLINSFFFNLCNEIIFNFIDFVYSKLFLIA